MLISTMLNQITKYYHFQEHTLFQTELESLAHFCTLCKTYKCNFYNRWDL